MPPPLNAELSAIVLLIADQRAGVVDSAADAAVRRIVCDRAVDHRERRRCSRCRRHRCDDVFPETVLAIKVNVPELIDPAAIAGGAAVRNRAVGQSERAVVLDAAAIARRRSRR